MTTKAYSIDGPRRIPLDLPPESVTAVIDSREQRPLDLSPLAVTTGTLTTGDYSVRHLEHVISIERKSLNDLLKCVGTDRDRFGREVERLLAFPVRGLVVEATWPEIEKGEWRGKIKPAAVLGSLFGWMAQGLPVMLFGDHERAGRYVSRLLLISARRRWRESRSFANHIIENTEVDNGTY